MQIVDMLSLQHAWSVEIFVGLPANTQAMPCFRPVALVENMEPSLQETFWDPDWKKKRLPTSLTDKPSGPRRARRAAITDGPDGPDGGDDVGGGEGGVVVCPPDQDDWWTHVRFRPDDAPAPPGPVVDPPVADPPVVDPPPVVVDPPPVVDPPAPPDPPPVPPVAPAPPVEPVPPPPPAHPVPRQQPARRAKAHERDVWDPASGRLFHELWPDNVFTGHCLVCDNCGFPKTYNWYPSRAKSGMTTEGAFLKLLTWELQCPGAGEREKHKHIGGLLLKDIHI